MKSILAKYLDVHALGALTRDGRILFATRIVRLFAYGLVSVILFLYLTELGFSEAKAGWLLTLTLIGDTAISLPITIMADRMGRRKMLLAGAGLMFFAGIVFVMTGDFWLLLIAATIGVISPSGSEVGPFLAIEQASLSQISPGEKRTGIFAWYNLFGSLATATGALAAGWITQILISFHISILGSYRLVLSGYAFLGVLLAVMFLFVSRKVEIERPTEAPKVATLFGLHRSKRVVMGLSMLFSLDAFAGGFVMQSLLVYWFHVRFGANIATLGTIFFVANILAGVSALTASHIAKRFGLINTMVFTHIPSNILLILVPLMPNLPLAILMLLLRFSISQMDVPTRQSYTMAVVDPDERSAAAGVTGVARTAGASIAPVFASRFLAAAPLISLPFYVAGGLKIIYDLMLWRSFRAVKEK